MPLLGWIPPRLRTQDQHDAHARAVAKMRAFTLPYKTPPVGTKVILTDFWKKPEVVKDVGFEFTGFRQLTGSCFPAGTPVRMHDGCEKPVEDVVKGDLVITHTGAARRVIATMTRKFDGDMVTINVSGFPFPLEMTADHPVAVSTNDGGIIWKKAECLDEGDLVLIGRDRANRPSQKPLDVANLLGDDVIVLDELMKDFAFTKGSEPDVPNSNISSARQMVRRSGIDWQGRVRLRKSRVENSIRRYISVCPSLGRLIGLYLAEGGCDAGRVVFTFDVKEESLAEEVLALVRGLFGVEGDLHRQESRPSVIQVRISNQNVAEIFKVLIPGNVYTKRVPRIFFGASEETRLALLLGWMDGDGYVGIKRGIKPGNVRITGVTVCAGLARDMTTLAISCGLRATCVQRKARMQSKVSYGVDLAGKKAVSLFPAVAFRANGPRYNRIDSANTKFGYARKIRRIERRHVEGLQVFDFEVEEDHSFIAGGITVHNCVGVSTGNWIFTLAAIQRLLASGTTKAFVPFWPFIYGRTRFNEGDRGQGEGAIDSSAGDTVAHDGYFDITQPGLPTFDRRDGLAITSSQEMQYSDGNSSLNTKWLGLASQHVGAKASVNSPEEIATAILNGYPVIDGDENYIGNGSIKGSGTDAYTVGHYDGRGGHSTCFLGYWNHPNDGELFLYSNQWDGNTYPTDPAGGGRCTVWTPRSEVVKHFNSGGGSGGETIALSHVDWFPEQVNEIINCLV